jgi:hypothetical protein
VDADAQSQAFLDTCAALEREDLPEAKAAIFRLQRAGPVGPELRILAFLYEARLHTPHAGWVMPFLEGWADAGRPRALPLLDRAVGATPAVAPDEADVLRALQSLGTDPGLCALIVKAWHRHDANSLLLASEELAKQARTLPLQLVAIGLLRRIEGSPDIQEHARSTARWTLQRIAQAVPYEPALQARALLEGTSREEPLSDDEIETLQAISRRPRGHQSVAQLYRTFAGAYGGTVTAKQLALADACRLFDMHWIAVWCARAALRAQLEASRAEALSDAMERLGEQIATGRSSLEALWGLALVKDAARLRGDEQATRAVVPRLEELLGLVKLELPAIQRWPIAPLADEFLDWAGTDELGLKRKAFAAG